MSNTPILSSLKVINRSNGRRQVTFQSGSLVVSIVVGESSHCSPRYDSDHVSFDQFESYELAILDKSSGRKPKGKYGNLHKGQGIGLGKLSDNWEYDTIASYVDRDDVEKILQKLSKKVRRHT